jgi:hypothetical protein
MVYIVYPVGPSRAYVNLSKLIVHAVVKFIDEWRKDYK